MLLEVGELGSHSRGVTEIPRTFMLPLTVPSCTQLLTMERIMAQPPKPSTAASKEELDSSKKPSVFSSTTLGYAGPTHIAFGKRVPLPQDASKTSAPPTTPLKPQTAVSKDRTLQSRGAEQLTPTVTLKREDIAPNSMTTTRASTRYESGDFEDFTTDKSMLNKLQRQEERNQTSLEPYIGQGIYSTNIYTPTAGKQYHFQEEDNIPQDTFENQGNTHLHTR